MRFTRSMLLLAAALVFAFESVSAAGIITTTDASGRPTEITGFMTNSNVYNITITYNIDGFVNPITVGDLPEADINLAADDLASFLEAEDPLADGAFVSILFHDPSSSFPDDGDPLTFDAYANVFGDSTPSFSNGGVTNTFNTMSPFRGLIEFTTVAIPEPSSLVLFGMVFPILHCRRRK